MALIRRDFKGVTFFVLKIIATWIVAFWIYVILRNVGIDQSQYFERVAAPDFIKEFWLSIAFGVLIGLAYSAIEIFFDRPYFRKISFGKGILIKTFIYFLTI